MNKPILVIRTVSVEKLSPVLDSCRELWPANPVWVLTTPGRLGEITGDRRVARAVSYSSESGRGFDAPIRVEKDFQNIVVPVANESGSGYGNVLKACRRLRFDSFMLCTRCTEMRKISRSRINLLWRVESTLGVMALLLGSFWADRWLERDDPIE